MFWNIEAKLCTCADVRRVDGLINCAGVRTARYERDARGVELQYSTNFLGAFLLTNLLADKMLNQTNTDESAPDTAYVVNVDCVNASKLYVIRLCFAALSNS